jgi:hypothetical protein
MTFWTRLIGRILSELRCSAFVCVRRKHAEPQSSARARSDVADMYHDEVITKVRSNLDSTMVAAVHRQPHRELNGSKGAKSARGVCRVNSPVSCSLR